MGTVRSSITVSSCDVLATAITVYKADDKTTSAYLYVKNMDPELENYLYLINTTDSNGAVAKIGGGEFCFIPVFVSKTYKVYGTLVDQMVEYLVFGQDNPANTLG